MLISRVLAVAHFQVWVGFETVAAFHKVFYNAVSRWDLILPVVVNLVKVFVFLCTIVNGRL